MDIPKIWRRFYKINFYYHNDTENLIKHLTPSDASVLEINCKQGELLSKLQNKTKYGVDINNNLINIAKKLHPKIKFLTERKLFNKAFKKKFDYIVLNHSLSDASDVQLFIKKIKKNCHESTKIIVIYFNFFWKPFLDIAEKIGLRFPSQKIPNWLSEADIQNFFYLENFEKIKIGKRFIFPYNVPFIANFINKYISQLPLVNSFCLTSYLIFKPKIKKRDYSVSIIIPARNEEGNMKSVLKKIPIIGKRTEVIFVEGHSKDNTYGAIANEIKKYKGKISARLFKQKGKGKGDAVRLGFLKAKNDLLIILDADLTVDPKELPKFYDAISNNRGDFIMGCRLVYPMEKEAMRNLNYLGNKFFSWMFTFLLGQRIKDTLCGTKVLLKRDYQKIAKNRYIFGDFDPFGDFDLIFGAAKLNLKIIEIPIRYKERTYGTTNINRFKHGLLLIKMVLFAAKNLKFV